VDIARIVARIIFRIISRITQDDTSERRRIVADTVRHWEKAIQNVYLSFSVQLENCSLPKDTPFSGVPKRVPFGPRGNPAAGPEPSGDPAKL